MVDPFHQPAMAIGGVGGSGTRAIATVLRSLGYPIGFDLNESLDDLTFTALVKDELLWPLEARRATFTDRLSSYVNLRGSLAQDGSNTKALDDFRANLPAPNEDNPWQTQYFQNRRLQLVEAHNGVSGPLIWKEPNTHIFLPLLLEILPHLHYIHVVRDGRDMAWSQNQTQLALWGSRILGRSIDADSAQDSFEYWCACHQRLLDIQHQWPDRVSWLCIDHSSTLEENTSRQARALDRVLSKMGVPLRQQQILDTLAREIHLPSSVGRHQAHPELAITAEQYQLLTRLGYS